MGVLDLSAAIVFGAFTGATPARVAQSIASGLFGRAAYAGGWRTAAIGVALHFFIAFCVAAVYVVASRRLPNLRARPLVAGAIYGLAVFLFMYRVVLPLAGLHAWPARWQEFARVIGAHLVAVGWPIAWWAHSAQAHLWRECDPRLASPPTMENRR